MAGQGMTPEQLANIQARANAATEGPWEIKTEDRETPSVWHDQEVAFSIGRCADCGVEAEYETADAEFISESRTDVPALLALVREQAAKLERVTALHRPEKRWMPHRDADRSYDTAGEAAQDLGHTYTIDPSNMPFFEVCAHCKTVEEGPCDGECTKELGYRESLWPCPTIAALTATEAK